MNVMVKAVEEGLAERKVDKEQERERDAANEEEAADDNKMATVTDEEGGDAPAAGRGNSKGPGGAGRPRKAGPRK